jgi:hypothetical protein
MTIDPGNTIRRMAQVTRPPRGVQDSRNVDFIILCDRMRPDEIEQYLALTGAKDYSPEVAARGFINMPGFKFSLVSEAGEVGCAGGFHEIIPGVWQSWMVGSVESWERDWRTITKGCRWVMDGLLAQGARRLQTTALASRAKAIEWYERGLGMQREGTWRNYGANGEDVACFARVGGSHG